MTSVPYALAWTMWRQHREGIRLQGTALLLLAVLSALAPQVVAGWSPIAAKGFFFLIAVLLSLPFTCAWAMFTYGTEGADVHGRESCFPPALFRLPVSSAWLAAWPMLAGAAIVASMWIAAALFLLRPWLAVLDPLEALPVPLWWPAFFAAALLAWSQAILWHSYGLPWFRVVCFLVIWALAGSTIVGLAESQLSEGTLCGLFAGCTLVGWGLGYVAVRRGRHGDTPDWRWLLLPVQRVLRWRWRRGGAFASARRAQLWSEWRLSGASQPILLAFTMPFTMWPLYFVGHLDALTRAEIGTDYSVPGLLALPVFMAGVFGSIGGGGYSPGMKSRKAGLGSFSAALPMTTTDMVAAMLKSAALSTLATWAIFVPLWTVAVGLAYDSEQLRELWQRASAVLPAAKILIGSSAVVGLAIVWTWKRQVDRLYFTLAGRVWVTNIAALMAVAAWVSLAMLAAFAMKNPRARVLIDGVAPWLLGLALLCRVLAAVWALRAVLRRGLVTPRTAALGLAVWLLIACLLIGLLVWSVPATFVPTHYVVFAVLFALPMVRLPGAPLVLDWNRHR